MPGNYNCTVYIGETFVRTVTIKVGGVPMDLANYSVSGRMRRNEHLETEVDFLCTKLTPSTDGKFNWEILATDVPLLLVDLWLYEINIEHSVTHVITRLLQGKATVLDAVVP